MRFTPAQEAELEGHWVWMSTAHPTLAKYQEPDRRFRLRECLEGLRSDDVDRQYGVRRDSVKQIEIGRWIANRRAKAAGVPRAKQKTPDQLAVLEGSFEDEVYPNHRELMRIITLTELSKTQITSWFETRRKLRIKDGGLCWTRTEVGWTGAPPPPEVAKAWREWKAKSEEMKAAFLEAERTGMGEQSRVQCRRPGVHREFSFLPDL